MVAFDYGVPAELFPARNRKYRRQPFGYRRFARAADAIRFAIEELPPELLLGTFLEVDGERYGSEGFVACTRAPVTSYPDTQRCSFYDFSYAEQICRLRPSIRPERRRPDFAARRVQSCDGRAVDLGIVLSGLPTCSHNDFRAGTFLS
jgi:hypothetical protein